MVCPDLEAHVFQAGAPAPWLTHAEEAPLHNLAVATVSHVPVELVVVLRNPAVVIVSHIPAVVVAARIPAAVEPEGAAYYMLMDMLMAELVAVHVLLILAPVEEQGVPTAPPTAGKDCSCFLWRWLSFLYGVFCEKGYF